MSFRDTADWALLDKMAHGKNPKGFEKHSIGYGKKKTRYYESKDIKSNPKGEALEKRV